MKEFIDKLIGRLEELKTEALDKWDGGASHRAYSKAIDIANELAEEYKDKDCSKCSKRLWYQKGYADAEKEYKVGWVPCSERLPELTEGTECFKQSKCCLTTLKWWDGDMTESVGWYNQSGVWNEDSKNCKVIAWMPLPQPYTVPPTEQLT